jgi:hypothetical protein
MTANALLTLEAGDEERERERERERSLLREREEILGLF